MIGHHLRPWHSTAIRFWAWFWAFNEFRTHDIFITVYLGFACACVSSFTHTQKTHRYNWTVWISVKHKRVTTTVIIVVAVFRVWIVSLQGHGHGKLLSYGKTCVFITKKTCIPARQRSHEQGAVRQHFQICLYPTVLTFLEGWCRIR